MSPDSKENQFSAYVRILGKGKTGSRSLNETEAYQAMRLILAGEVADVQLGAFLMLLRVKEESAEELAGFVSACREFIKKPKNAVNVDLDWSSYAGKRKQPHWFILSALLLAQSGIKIFMHGTAGHTEGRIYTSSQLKELNIPVAKDLNQANEYLAKNNFAFTPLGNFCNPLQRIIDLRPLFGLRSPVHTLCRLLNPLMAKATLQSVFHPSYMTSHHDAAKLLGEQNAIVFKGDAGEVEYRPHASVKLKTLNQGTSHEITLDRHAEPPCAISPDTERLTNLWKNSNSEALEPYGYNATIGTAAIALLAMGTATDKNEAFEQAKTLWRNRCKEQLV